MKLWFGIVLLLCLVLLALAPITDPGSRLLLRAVERVTPLEIGYRGGSLVGELRLSRVALASGSMALELRDIVSELAPSCLWRSAICFKKLRVGQLTVTLQPGIETAADDPAAGRLLEIPVQIEADMLSIASAHVSWPGGEWRQGALVAEVKLGGNELELVSARISGARLQVPESAADSSPSGGMVTLPQIELPLVLQIGDLYLEDSAWDVYGSQGQLRRLQLQGRWRKQQLHLGRLAVDAGDWGQAQLQGKLRFSGSWPLEADMELELARPPVWDGLHERRVSLRARGDLAQLKLVAQAADPAELVVRGEINALHPGLPFSASVRALWREPLPLSGIDGVPAALADVELLSPLTADLRGSLDEQQFQLRGVATGLGYESLALAADGVHSEGRVRLERVLLQDAGEKNHLSASGELSLGDHLQWSLALQSSGLDLPQLSSYAAGRLQGRLRFSGEMDGAAWQVAVADVDVRGDVNDLPARISGFAGLGQDLAFGSSDLQAQINGANFLLQSSGVRDTPGRVELSLDDLGRWRPGTRGSLDLQAVVAAVTGDLQVSGAIRGVRWGDADIESGIVQGTYRPRSAHAFDLVASLTEVSLATIGFDGLQLRATGDEKNQSLVLDSLGDVTGQLALAGALDGATWRGALAPAVLRTAQGDWQLEQAVEMTFLRGESRLAIAGHCWRQSATRICPGALDLGDEGRGSLEVTGDMAFLAGFFPQEVEVQGQLQVQLHAAWTPDSGLSLNGNSTSSDVRITRYFAEGETATMTWDSAEGVLQQRDDGLQVNGEILRGGRRVVSLEMLFPRDREQSGLSGRLSLEQLQLADLTPLAPRLAELGGELNGSLQLSGSMQQPLATGVLQLSGGRVMAVGNPTLLEALDLSLDMRGDRVLIEGRGLLGGGPLELRGQLALQGGPRLELTAKGEKHQLLLPPYTHMMVSENLQLQAAGDLLVVAGEVTVHEGLLEHEQLPRGSVAVSPDVVVVDYSGNVIREERPFDVSMDVWLRMQDSFQVIGGGLRTTVGGDLRVVQEPGQPMQLFGNLQVLGGDLKAYGQRLLIRQGNIAFAGNPGNPQLDMRADREFPGDRVTVGVLLRGSLQEPVLDVYSDPAMSQSETMSYLVRGRGMDSGASADSTALALAMGTSLVNSSGIVAGINRLPGISNVEFGTAGTAEDAAATVSGYVGERIYLSYGIGLYEPINVMTARLYLQTRLWLEVVSRLDNSLDLYYSFDIQ